MSESPSLRDLQADLDRCKGALDLEAIRQWRLNGPYHTHVVFDTVERLLSEIDRLHARPNLVLAVQDLLDNCRLQEHPEQGECLHTKALREALP